MKKMLLYTLIIFLVACKKEVTQTKPTTAKVVFEIESNTSAPIHAHYGQFYHNSSATGSDLMPWEIASKGTFTKSSSYELNSVSAEGDALCPGSGDWVYRVKTASGKILQEKKPVFYSVNGYEYYSVTISVNPE